MNDLYRALASVFPADRLTGDDAVLAGYAADSAIAPGSATLPGWIALSKHAERPSRKGEEVLSDWLLDGRSI